MDLSIAISPEHEHEDAVVADASLASPMSKHQRQLSLSAKWASNKALALEYLKRQREVILWMEHILGAKLPSTDLHESLKSGVVLRELLEKLFPDTAHCLSPISRNYSSRMAPWKERENISIFLKQCKALGMNDLSLFCTDDLYDGNNMVQVMFCIQDFMRFSQEHSGHFLHPVFDDHVTFSNQEVEMALSKIEKAGMDASKLKDLMNGSSAGSAEPSPERKAKSGSEDDTDADSLLASSDDERECHDDEEDEADGDDEEESALDALEEELQALASERDDGHDCNQSVDAIDSDADDDADNDADVEPAFDDDEELDEGTGDEEEDDDVFGDDEEEIVSLLSDLVSAIEDAHIVEAHERALLSDGGDELKFASVQARDLESDLEAAKCMELPLSRAPSEQLLESDVLLISLSATDHRIESEARTELMDVGKSDTTVLTDSGRPGHTRSHGDDDEARASDAKSPKKAKRGKSTKTAKRKKSRNLSDEQLDAEAMSRCTCGSKCTIM